MPKRFACPSVLSERFCSFVVGFPNVSREKSAEEDKARLKTEEGGFPPSVPCRDDLCDHFNLSVTACVNAPSGFLVMTGSEPA